MPFTLPIRYPASLVLTAIAYHREVLHLLVKRLLIPAQLETHRALAPQAGITGMDDHRFHTT